jgi:2-(1,2-epoxy-1,2-dihydrophenyl)acetyl-CoA isomerase
MQKDTAQAERKVLFAKVGSVGKVTLNRPGVLNACDLETLKQFSEQLKEIEADTTVRCVVITGAGRGFCVGADLNSLRKRSEEAGGQLSFRQDLLLGFNPIIRGIRNLDRPVIAMVNGVAAGAGLGIAMACDIRFASENATFIEAFARVGLVPDSGVSFFLPRYVGLSKAYELAYTGEGLSAEEALRFNLVSKVLPPGKLEEATMEFANRIAAGPTRALGIAKEALNRGLTSSLEEALDFEGYAQELAGKTTDHKEGISAFLEKRIPKFSGQ